MSRLWRDDLRVGLCPDRLVIERRSCGWRHARSREIVPHAGDPVSALAALGRRAAITVIVSNHFVRYAVLTGSPTLRSAADWDAFARYSFASTYGAEAEDWHIRLSATAAPHERVASAVNADMVARLRAVPGIRSIQPYLMAAFNQRRAALARQTVWLVLQEPARLAIARVDKGSWKSIRVRHAGEDWSSRLPEILDREAAISDAPECTRALVWCEGETPPSGDRHELVDITLRAGTSSESRPYAMALH